MPPTPQDIATWVADHERMLGRLASPWMLRQLAGGARKLALFSADKMNRWDLAQAWRAAAAAFDAHADEMERKG